MENNTKLSCNQCSKPLHGRTDKKFCNDFCRSTWHNARNQKDNNFSRRIHSIIRRNRNKLKELIGKRSVITKRELDQCSFNWEYHTHCKMNKKGIAVIFCFDYGIRFLPGNKIQIIYQPQP